MVHSDLWTQDRVSKLQKEILKGDYNLYSTKLILTKDFKIILTIRDINF